MTHDHDILLRTDVLLCQEAMLCIYYIVWDCIIYIGYNNQKVSDVFKQFSFYINKTCSHQLFKIHTVIFHIIVKKQQSKDNEVISCIY